jgi:hypothetical protein
VQFQSSGNSGGTFTFTTGNSNIVTINGAGLVSFGDVRATIFYDQDNTGFFVDPASTSNLQGLTVASTITGNARSATNATLVDCLSNRTDSASYQVAWVAPNQGTNPNSGNPSTYAFSCAAVTIQSSTGTLNATNLVASGNTTSNEFYANNWFRNNGSNEGLYNEATTQHLSSNTNGYWDVSSTTNASTGVVGIRLYAGGHVNTLRGFLFSNEIGFGLLNNTGNWAVRCYTGSLAGGELSGAWDASFDFRTQILYDRNNTALYFDGSNAGDSIRVAGDVVAYFSDERLKDIKENIPNALEKVLSLNGFYYEPNEIAQRLGYEKKLEIGLSAQEVESILPEIIKQAPADVRYKTLNYAKLTPLLVEAIKEQQSQIESQQQQINKLTELINNLTK